MLAVSLFDLYLYQQNNNKTILFQSNMSIKTYKLTTSEYISQKDPRIIKGIEHDLEQDLEVNAEIEVENDEIKELYVYARFKEILLKEDFGIIEYNGGSISSAKIEFSNLKIILL